MCCQWSIDVLSNTVFNAVLGLGDFWITVKIEIRIK